MIRIDECLTPTQKGLFAKLAKQFRGAAANKGSYILVPGQSPVMLLAHLDTVHREPVRVICRSDSGNILMSPQGIGGDDRCGVYALVKVHERSQAKPWLLFTCDEEMGGRGAAEFCDRHAAGRLPKEIDCLKLLIEVDRKGKADAVYYDCDNPGLEDYITGKGFRTAYGSFGDISLVAPELGVAAANLSSGYYNAHTQHEYINMKHLDATIRKVLQIVADAADPEFPRYEYIESTRSPRFGGISYGDGLSQPEKGHGWVMAGREFPGSLPEGIRHDYAALLDYYTIEELEAVRAEYGDHAIAIMCESELGFTYSYGEPWLKGKEGGD